MTIAQLKHAHRSFVGLLIIVHLVAPLQKLCDLDGRVVHIIISIVDLEAYRSCKDLKSETIFENFRIYD